MSERTRMLDITRDKPIKVAVRVAVPVRDHPKVFYYYFTLCCFLVFSDNVKGMQNDQVDRASVGVFIDLMSSNDEGFLMFSSSFLC